MFYVKITTDKGGSSMGLFEGVRRSMTRTDSTIIKIGDQGYIRKMSDADHEKLTTQIETSIMSGATKLTLEGTWAAR